MTGSRVQFEGISKRFPGRRAVDALSDVSLVVPQGSIFGIVGYSGAGKSTLIRMANALERPSEGRVIVDGVDIATLSGPALRAAKKRTGMVFQTFNLLESLTVLDNVAEPLALDGVSRAERHERAREVLAFVGLADKEQSRPSQLSGGQKQRVGIARAIVRNPSLLLCDEATSALDPTTTKHVIELLRKINETYGVTILLVTHEMDVIKDLCTHVAVMEEGRVVEVGDVLDVFVDPASPTTRDFVRTVMPDGLPEELPSILDSGRIWKLRMLGGTAAEPLMASLIRTYGLDINILYAHMTWLRGEVVGQMSVEVDGPEEARARALAYLDEIGVLVEEETR